MADLGASSKDLFIFIEAKPHERASRHDGIENHDLGHDSDGFEASNTFWNACYAISQSGHLGPRTV